jgi:propanol-preferring alcohol dehydrogenase
MAAMRAMVLDRPRTPLVLRERPVPAAGVGELLSEVAACGVCRTDLHVVDGELERPKLPIVLGHEIVGRVAGIGAGVRYPLARHEALSDLRDGRLQGAAV